MKNDWEGGAPIFAIWSVMRINNSKRPRSAHLNELMRSPVGKKFKSKEEWRKKLRMYVAWIQTGVHIWNWNTFSVFERIIKKMLAGTGTAGLILWVKKHGEYDFRIYVWRTHWGNSRMHWLGGINERLGEFSRLLY